MTWERATHAIALLAVDPAGLGGIVIRARHGPVRAAFLESLSLLPSPQSRLHPMMEDDAIFGGLDLTETLRLGRFVEREGLLSRSGTMVLTMGERCDATLAARLSAQVDKGKMPPLVILDEGSDPDEATPSLLIERLAFHITLDLAVDQIGILPSDYDFAQARERLDRVRTSVDAIRQITEVCLSLGIDSARAPLFALRAARANAALAGRSILSSDDIETAVAFCLSHRAVKFPSPSEDEDPAPQETSPDQCEASEQIEGPDQLGRLDDRVLEAAMANLPAGLLDGLQPRGTLGAGSGAGAKRKGNRRGRPRPSRPGVLSGRNRLDLIATLRSAAPWQKLRGAEAGRIKVSPSDFRIRQFEDKSDRVLIFAVDASGSAAIARLAEAKGAVELLLSEAYARRDHVSLVSFRGQAAQTLLPPTRSLVQTKRRLAGLPGGGGTPLAAGLVEALALAETAQRQGMTPCIVLLTDGRANIALNGDADRKAAATDAASIARHIRSHKIDTIVLDLGNRPTRDLEGLAHEMDGMYVPLPRADARRMSSAVSSALGT
ncbi:MAG: magnesium chelatase subunit D [Pseudomonadota bacterium]